MSGARIGFWARIGGAIASLFLKGKSKQKAIDISDQAGSIAEAMDDKPQQR